MKFSSDTGRGETERNGGVTARKVRVTGTTMPGKGVAGKNAAIDIARQNGVDIQECRCVFSNINRGNKNVWWFDVPVEKAIRGVAILLCDGKDERLYCLVVPGSVFRDNAGDFFHEDVKGVDKFRIEPSASEKDFMKDRRSHSAGVCFNQFVKTVIAFD